MRSARTVFRFSVFACFTLAFTGCYKQPLIPFQDNKIYVDTTSLSYFASYKSGSLWVYQQEGSSKTDTVEEWSYNDLFYGFGGDQKDYANTQFSYENITVGYYSQLMGNIYTTAARAEDDLTDCYFAFSGLGLMQNPELREANNVFYPTFYIEINETNIPEILDSFQVLNKTFRNVLHIKGYMGPGFSELYFAKNIGIIERRITNYPAFLIIKWTIKK